LRLIWNDGRRGWGLILISADIDNRDSVVVAVDDTRFTSEIKRRKVGGGIVSGIDRR
jgi:hypothetical protein